MRHILTQMTRDTDYFIYELLLLNKIVIQSLKIQSVISYLKSKT